MRSYNKLILILGFIALLSACIRQPEYTHTNLIYAKPEMVSLMKSVHLLEAKLLLMPKDSMLACKTQRYDSLFNAHSIDSATYVSYMEYYLARPDLMAEIYEEVMDSLTVMEKKQIQP